MRDVLNPPVIAAVFAAGLFCAAAAAADPGGDT
jgi:hypothetical protein